MVPSSSGGPSRPMNDWMTSVADIPDDADDDLSGISPELVLVDPELARLVRERQPVPATPALTRASMLRLVRAIDPTEEAEAPIVPRPSPRTDVEVSPTVRDEPSMPIPAAPRQDEAADARLPSVAPPAPAIEAEPEPAVDPVTAAPVVAKPEPEPAVDPVPAASVVAEPEPEVIVPATRIVEAESTIDAEPGPAVDPVPAASVVAEPEPELIIPAARIVEAESTIDAEPRPAVDPVRPPRSLRSPSRS